MEKNLLINEPPLVLIPSLAVKHGLENAIVMQQMHYWHQKGYEWIRNTYAQWHGQFPFWSERTIRRRFNILESLCFINSKIENLKANDLTKSYQLQYGQIGQANMSSMAKNGGQTGQLGRMDVAKSGDSSIVREYTETTTETTGEILRSNYSNHAEYSKAYWENQRKKKAQNK